MQVMNILVVEDHFLVRMSMKIVLQELYSQASISESESFDHAIATMRGNPYDLILLDIELPGGQGTGMIGRIRQFQPDAPILVCSAADEQKNALAFIAAGANGFLSKTAEKSETVKAIVTVVKKSRYVSPAIQERLLDVATFGKQNRKRPVGIKSLSGREREITDLLVAGKWVKEIAAQLDIQSNTVSTYKARIFEKLGVDNVIDLAKKLREE
ncbi:two component transcriptional regulator, LuxR family [Dyadobacter sp. SG02]|uniref:response regulator n=1 Tax=Dyadobacter sp. SG02 TaxID=1855291 RepID=UPI0008AFC18B|nr:response regulator transcription factor [Dyadobacter sp. SG02]SEI56776.1 two component transcriptional regulator, LuxR family [Dyadobacter sp. SG02]